MRSRGNDAGRTLAPVAALVALLGVGCGGESMPGRCGGAAGAPVVAIALGREHALALSADGRVKAWGWNAFGQLGLGDTESRGDAPHEMGKDLAPVDLGGDCRASAISAPGGSFASDSLEHGHHGCAIVAGGHVKCWGYNHDGQLGLGDTDNRGDDGGEMGGELPTVDLGAGRTAISIVTGPRHTCAILDGGALKCWGMNSAGYLGLGDTETRGDEPGEMGDHLPVVDLGTGRTVVALSLGHARCALLDDDSLKCWGRNDEGQLGQGDTRVRGDGPGQMGDALTPVDLGAGRHATSMAGGDHHACAVLDDASVKCWGENGDGQLGLGDTERRGDQPGEMGDHLPAIDLGAHRTATAVAAGDAHTCAILDDGRVKCWGANASGQLGLGDTRPRGARPGEMGDALAEVDLGPGARALAISCGHARTCALLDGGRVKCWGLDDTGQLGLGDTRARGGAPHEMGTALPAVSLF